MSNPSPITTPAPLRPGQPTLDEWIANHLPALWDAAIARADLRGCSYPWETAGVAVRHRGPNGARPPSADRYFISVVDSTINSCVACAGLCTVRSSLHEL